MDTILIIDDDAGFLESMADILAPYYATQGCASGVDGLDWAKAHRPDLILLDVMMEDLDGKDVCRQLKAGAETRDIPVIFVSSLDSAQDETLGLSLGAIDYLSKPINTPIALARIANHLKLKHHEDELSRLNLSMEDMVRRRTTELRESETRYRAVFEQAAVGVAQIDTSSGRFLSINRKYCEILGYAQEQMLQLDFQTITHPDDLTADLANMERMKSGQIRDFEMEKRLFHQDGHVVWVHLTVSPMWEPGATPDRHIAVVQDITAHKRAEEVLRESEFRWKFALEGAGDGVWDWNLETGKMLFSRSWKDMLGYADDELGDSLDDWKQLVKPDDMKKAMIALESYMDGIEPPPYHAEYRMLCKDGSWKWVLSRGMVVNRAGDGRPLRMIGTHTDITDRVLAQEKLLTLSRAVENSPASVVITSLDGTIEYVNQRFTAVTGYLASEAVGQNPRILKSDKQSPDLYQLLWQTILAGNEWQGELLNRKKNGEIYLEQVSISPIRDENGAVAHFVAVKQDITLQRQAEEDLRRAKEAAEKANLAKDEFLANITHELRTPLSAVIGFSGLARPFCTDPRQREYLDKVNSAGKTLSHIIDDLLDLSKIAAGHLELEPLTFSLRQIIQRSSSLISYKAQEKGLEMVERIDPEIPDVLVGDTLRLEQILLNLLSNAVKFTTAGRVELRVGLDAREAQRVCLNIEVEDTGIGLSESETGKLFKPFSQADASMTRKYGGTGLGLAICKRLAELMDGDISFTSCASGGTTFRVRLWLGLGNPGDLPAVEEPGQESARVRYQGACVLVVDDQPFNRDIVEGLLAVVGIIPHLASNGQEALDLLASRAQDFDLVLMDIQMPVMDGLTATRMIRRLDGFKELPIIAMTAHTMAHERETSVVAGMNDHIGKPFDEAGFYRVLAKWIPQGKQRLLAVPATLPASASSFPLLHGVDTQAGLALLLGDAERYRHWLGSFVAEVPALLAQIRRGLATGKPESASMAAHSLKGRTGLLGMKQLHAVAEALEAAIDAAEPASELLRRLELDVAAMCAEIQCRLDPETGVERAREAVEQVPLPGLPPGLPPASVMSLIACLDAGDSDCDRLVTDCLIELKDTPWAPYLRQALQYVQNFNFAAAGELLAGERAEAP